MFITLYPPKPRPKTAAERMVDSPLQESPDGVWKLGEIVRVLRHGSQLGDAEPNFGSRTPAHMTIYRISDSTIMLYNDDEQYMKYVSYKTLDHTIVKKGTPITHYPFGHRIKSGPNKGGRCVYEKKA